MNEKVIDFFIVILFIFGLNQNSFGKKLEKNPTELALFNALLQRKPLITARAKYTVQLIEAIEKKLEETKIDGKYNVNQKTVIAYRDVLLAPMIKKRFEKDTTLLEDILEVNFIVKPIVLESLGENKKDSLLIKFLDIKKEESGTYFQKNISDVETLIESCYEFKAFMQDVIDSMSEEAKKSYEELEKKMLDKKTSKNTNAQTKKIIHD